MIRFHASDDAVLTIRFTPDAQRLAIGSSKVRQWTQISIWDWKTATELVRHRRVARIIALSQDHALLAVQDPDGELTIRDTYSFERRFMSVWVRQWFGVAQFQPESSVLHALVESQHSAHTLQLTFDYEKGVDTMDSWCEQPIGSAAFRADSRAVAFVTMDAEGVFLEAREWSTNQRIAKWNIARLPPVERRELNSTQVLFSPDGGTIALWNAEFAQTWDLASATQRFSLVGHRDRVTCLAFSPDGKCIATGGADRQVRIWDATNGTLIATYDWEIGPVRALAFAPNGLTCAAGGESGDVVIWDV